MKNLLKPFWLWPSLTPGYSAYCSIFGFDHSNHQNLQVPISSTFNYIVIPKIVPKRKFSTTSLKYCSTIYEFKFQINILNCRPIFKWKSWCLQVPTYSKSKSKANIFLPPTFTFPDDFHHSLNYIPVMKLFKSKIWKCSHSLRLLCNTVQFVSYTKVSS